MHKTVVATISWTEAIETIRSMATEPQYERERIKAVRGYDADVLEAAAREIRKILAPGSADDERFVEWYESPATHNRTSADIMRYLKIKGT